MSTSETVKRYRLTGMTESPASFSGTSFTPESFTVPSQRPVYLTLAEKDGVNLANITLEKSEISRLGVTIGDEVEFVIKSSK